jgi:hypothetical protein
MKKKVLSLILSSTLFLSACGGAAAPAEAPVTDEGQQQEAAVTSEDTAVPSTESAAGETAAEGTDEVGKIYYDPDLVPSVPDYKVEDDFSNVKYHKNFGYLFDPAYDNEYTDTSLLRNALIKNNFAVRKDEHSEFFDVYESNRYNVFPNFVTVDSLMHTYHLYFSYLLKSLEKDYLSDRLLALSTQMLQRSLAQYQSLKGTDYEKAALRNVAFFYIGSSLQDENTAAPLEDADFKTMVDTEKTRIMEASAIDDCLLTGLKEDYTQYKPRGYYEGDEKLENYFRAMMFYGRMAFALDDEDAVRSSALMAAALSEDDKDYTDIYDITSFFAGASDDMTYGGISQILTSVYGSIPDAAGLTADNGKFTDLMTALKSAAPPRINSIPVLETEENVIPSFRFMGQRFTIDAAIMQNLVYRAVEENPEGERRTLPDALDAAAALGSEKALKILEEQGDTDFKNYTDNMVMMQDTFNNADPKLWDASLYSSWLYTLRPLFEEKGKGYPSYMQSEEWAKKDLETFAGSFAELKHDTILYAKSVMAEMGGGDDEDIPDDRGYVDPEPVIYSRFAALSDKTSGGLADAGMLSDDARDDLALLFDMAIRLLEISEKELKNEALTDDDYEFIRCYGGNLEHFWQKVNEDAEESMIYSYQAPCPVIADIATDPNGAALEVGSGYADTVFVVFPIDGELHVGSGSVYSFYQFTVPIDQRMTDTDWRHSLASGYYDDDFNWIHNDNKVPRPEWTESYRIEYR